MKTTHSKAVTALNHWCLNQSHLFGFNQFKKAVLAEFKTDTFANKQWHTFKCIRATLKFNWNYCLKGKSIKYNRFNLPEFVGLEFDGFAYMRRLRKDLVLNSGEVVIPKGRLITNTLIRRANKHRLEVNFAMLEPLQSKPRSTNPAEKLLVSGVETTLKGIGPKDHQKKIEGCDMVNHPPHYTKHPSGVECIQITEHMGFNLGNAVKYIWRADLKGTSIQDLEKARWYIERELQKRKGEK